MMKLKKMMGLVLATLGLVTTAVHAHSDYFPPERMHCNVNALGKLSCQGLNSEYLVESSAIGLKDSAELFFFTSGEVTFSQDQKEALVIFTYKTPSLKVVTLRGASSAIRPNLDHPDGWVRLAGDTFVCSAYMRCPINKK